MKLDGAGFFKRSMVVLLTLRTYYREFYLISYMAFRPTDVRKKDRGFEPLRGASLEQDPFRPHTFPASLG